MAKIFVSHSTADAGIVERLKENLDRWGYQSVFVAPDSVLGPTAGARWRNELYRGITDAQLVLVLWSENFRESAWGAAERSLAHDAKESQVPVSYAGPNAINYGPAMIVFGDDSARSMWDDAMESSRRSHRVVQDVSVTRKGDLVATASGDGTCRVLDVVKGAEIARFSYEYALTAVAITPTGDQVAYATQSGKVFMRSLRAVTGKELNWEAKWTKANKLVFSPDGKTLACAGNGELSVYDAADGQPIPVNIDGGYNGATCVAFSGDGSMPRPAARRERHMSMNGRLDRSRQVRARISRLGSMPEHRWLPARNGHRPANGACIRRTRRAGAS